MSEYERVSEWGRVREVAFFFLFYLLSLPVQEHEFESSGRRDGESARAYAVRLKEENFMNA
jgi:hypothetical protein